MVLMPKCYTKVTHFELLRNMWLYKLELLWLLFGQLLESLATFWSNIWSHWTIKPILVNVRWEIALCLLNLLPALTTSTTFSPCCTPRPAWGPPPCSAQRRWCRRRSASRLPQSPLAGSRNWLQRKREATAHSGVQLFGPNLNVPNPEINSWSVHRCQVI